MKSSLGIDIGTSKAALVVLDARTKQLLHSDMQGYSADLNLGPRRSEQDVFKILESVEKLILNIPNELCLSIAGIGVTGQMHGVMLWNPETSETSNLINWQDQRCLEGGFVGDLKERCGDPYISTGYGCATLAWICKHAPESLEKYRFAATIYDYFVYRLCNLEAPLADSTSGASWGLFDLENGCFDSAKMSKAKIPKHLLPNINKPVSLAGTICSSYARKLKLPENIPVMTAIGDNQASLVSTLEDETHDVSLTLGTGGQVSLVLKELLPLGEMQSYEIRPYIDEQYLLVAASLCGGSAFAWLENVLTKWHQDLNLAALERNEFYHLINKLGLEAFDTDLVFAPNFSGERHAPDLRACIQNISLDNFSLGEVAAALAKGIIQNLKNMIPKETLRGRENVVGSGNALRKNPLLQKACECVFGIPLKLKEDKEEAAQGAAILALRNLIS